jgi:hypothetical protein
MACADTALGAAGALRAMLARGDPPDRAAVARLACAVRKALRDPTLRAGVAIALLAEIEQLERALRAARSDAAGALGTIAARAAARAAYRDAAAQAGIRAR